MAANIRLSKPNMTMSDGYFFTFNETSDILFEVTADGTTAFSYPLDTPLVNAVRSTEYDGVNYWTMEEGDVAGESVNIKRWRIDNYICKLQEEWDLESGVSHKYDSQAFTVEHYHATVTGTAAVGSSVVGIDEDLSSVITASIEVTFGPNENGEFETIGVASVSGTEITLDSPTEYLHNNNSACQFYTNVWLFNDYDGITADAGALYKLNPYSPGAPTMAITDKYSGIVYTDVQAATFYEVNSFFATYGNVQTLIYAKASNLLFVNTTENAGGTLDYYGSLAMDNVGSGGSSIDPVIDIAIDYQNIYRLENIDSGNNYALSTLDSLVASVAVSASKAIVPANGATGTTITATVRDQFFQPMEAKEVTFSENGDGSFPAGTENTDATGKASKVYTVGTSSTDVTVTCTVSQ